MFCVGLAHGGFDAAEFERCILLFGNVINGEWAHILNKKQTNKQKRNKQTKNNPPTDVLSFWNSSSFSSTQVVYQENVSWDAIPGGTFKTI